MTPLDSCPALPGGFHWTGDLDAWREHVEAGRIALLRPSDPQRAVRWAKVADFYGAHPSPGPAPDSTGQSLVIGVGAAGPLAQSAARVLGRSFVQVADLPGAVAVPVPDGGSVLLTALADTCSLADLGPLLHAWSQPSVRVGLLTGLDHPGLAFSFAKVLATRARQPQMHDVLLDGLTGTARTGPVLDERIPLDTTTVGGGWRTAVVEAHGWGSHALLGPYSVCGLTGERERDSAGEPVPGGCTSDRCRAGRTLTPLLLRDLPCRTLALFVCTALILDPHEHYPSSVSLAHAALEGHPSAVIGMMHHDLPVNGEPRLTGRLLAAGRPAGAITADLNDAAGSTSGYLLLGDPEQAFTATPQTATSPVFTPWSVRRPDLLTQSDSSERVTGLPTREGIWHEPEDAMVVSDGHEAAVGLRAELTGWLTALDAGALFEDNLRAKAMAVDRPKTRVVEGLKVMRRHREAARERTLAALQLVHKTLRARCGPLPTLPAELDRHASAWARALSEMSERARFGMLDQLTDAATATHTRDLGSTVAGPCRYCRGPLERTVWMGPVPGAAERIRVTCPRCGLVAAYPRTPAHTAVGLHSLTELVPGRTAPITVDLPGAAPGMWLTVQLRDRGRHALAIHHRAAAVGVTRVEIAVPADLQPEVHRIWVLVVDRFLPAWHQIRVPSTSAPPS